MTMKNTIKKYYSLLVMTGAMVLCLCACKETDYIEVISDNTTKPEPVSNVEVHNFNGGAHITYSLPESGNVLYVMAEYAINGNRKRQTKSSYYRDTVTVSGFEKSDVYAVTLYAVSRANVKSEPTTVEVHPDTPPYLLARPTIEMKPDFGGVNIKAVNTLKEPIGLILIAYDSITQGLEIQDQFYTEGDTIDYSVRGYAAVEQPFGVYITDQYGNVSDTLLQNLTPIFEMLLDKSKFFKYQLPTDGEIGYGWDLPYIWDNKTDGYSNGWHTNPGGSIPILCTFGLGVKASLSRFMLWERPDQWIYGHGNPKNFALWGSDKDSPQDAVLPANVEVGTRVGDWVNLVNCRFPDPPSGLPPSAPNDQDKAFVAAGVNFNFPPNTPSVKFIRFSVEETWDESDFAHFMEISIYGKPE
jgi:hypothetical protein